VPAFLTEGPQLVLQFALGELPVFRICRRKRKTRESWNWTR